MAYMDRYNTSRKRAEEMRNHFWNKEYGELRFAAFAVMAITELLQSDETRRFIESAFQEATKND